MLKSQPPVVPIAWVMIVLAWAVLVPLATPLLDPRRTCAWWPSLTVSACGRVASLGYLVGGVGWAVIALLGRDPAGVGDSIVVLTAMHFHYAGFGASLLVARLDDVRPVPWAVAAAVVGGPLVVAAGFLGPARLQAAGAVVLATGLAATSVLTLRGGVPAASPAAARTCLTLSAIAVWAGMALAVHWATAPYLGWRALSLETMARTHGVLNGVGFVGLGLLGRHLEVRRVLVDV